ncbi:DeoR/GlpR family DNA-binding transcription regulator [Roseospirillum parvum]|uniref:DeoR family transcriptional regulator, glycerol-3-phosphate regulon repressor n=1 Tax=Roseospirillum parvum TaxID=83401 RepID=A0A1G7TPL2_9PROT|nr:DeoR/GlpR family DNA-binding transcription regulator [Roseospirillum parvum]SDG37256.1 DeoR family transcriptional regulator, glycerol-3-phosphate regulon repressor [Roseospirillum parvum]
MSHIPPEERRARIAEEVRRQGAATIDALAGRFGVTEQTIRRDVNALCDAGLLRRRHGGVELPVQRENLPYESRQVLHQAEKQAIARAVAGLVPDGASVALSIGTTPELIARALVEHRDLKIYTNNLNVALALCANPGFEVTLPGGRVRNRYRDLVGAAQTRFFAGYNVDFGIFGVGGIDDDGELLDFAEEEVEARQAILANCRRALLVADHTKFGRNAVVRGGHLAEVDVLVTDRAPPPAMAARLDAAGVTVHLAPREALS